MYSPHGEGALAHRLSTDGEPNCGAAHNALSLQHNIRRRGIRMRVGHGREVSGFVCSRRRLCDLSVLRDPHSGCSQLSAARCDAQLGETSASSGSVGNWSGGTWGAMLGVEGFGEAPKRSSLLRLATRRLRRRPSSRLIGRYQGGNIPYNLHTLYTRYSCTHA